ncbi:hypothetical protein BGZ65_009291 [Modicella reniformis]|uniref:RRM domain-containing protein n=1 Tax=Modicella reniformis TaxID=1440133 RepID=A0A9P6MAV8_9FUNG|nr:hypothetical protein BGZ65_009291 [Modicella reniformis]
MKSKNREKTTFMEADEPYDFLNWHNNVSVIKDEKKEKKRLKKPDKEVKETAAKAAEKESSGSKSTNDRNKKRKKSAQSDDESDESDKDTDGDDDQKRTMVPESSSSEDSDDPDTQPPPKSKRKKVRKNKNKVTSDNDGSDEEAEAPEVEHGDVDEDDGSKKKKKKKTKQEIKGEKKEARSQKGEFGIWIGNLSYLTTEKALKHFFRNIGAQVTRVNLSGSTKRGGKFQNKGFAYVDFATTEAQENAIKLSESELDGRKVLIKSSKSFKGRPAVSKAMLQEKSLQQKHPVSSTLFVGNLSFQTTKEGLQKLFEECGEIRKVRLATFQDTGKCKGFAYIDYMSPEFATKALTDPVKRFFEGRKLNIEYASAEATLRGNPREYRKHKREEEATTGTNATGGDNATTEVTATADEEEEERRRFNAEQKAKRQRRQPGEGPTKKLQGHQRPGFALATAQRASQGIVEFKGSKITF